MHICLISPGHLSTNPRLVKEAAALRESGHRVSIVCGRYLPWGVAADHAIAAELEPVTAVPFGPSQLQPIAYLRATMMRHLARALVRAGWRSESLIDRAQHPAAGGLARAAKAIPADLYIAHYVAALPAAAAAAKLHGAAYAFDAEDFHLGDLPERPEHAFERDLICAIESRLLPHAAFVTTAAPLIADAYCAAYDIAPPTVVLNACSRRRAPAGPTLKGVQAPGPSVYWFSQVIGPGRGLEALIDAASQAQSAPHLYLRGSIAAAYAAQLQARAERLGIGNQLHLLELVAPGELELAGAHFDLGYAGELMNSPNHERALSNKLFSYLSSGIPVVISETPAQCAIAPQMGDAALTFPVGDAGALAQAIDAMLAPGRQPQSRRVAWELGQGRFAWETEAAKIVCLVQGCQ